MIYILLFSLCMGLSVAYLTSGEFVKSVVSVLTSVLFLVANHCVTEIRDVAFIEGGALKTKIIKTYNEYKYHFGIIIGTTLIGVSGLISIAILEILYK